MSCLHGTTHRNEYTVTFPIFLLQTLTLLLFPPTSKLHPHFTPSSCRHVPDFGPSLALRVLVLEIPNTKKILYVMWFSLLLRSQGLLQLGKLQSPAASIAENNQLHLGCWLLPVLLASHSFLPTPPTLSTFHLASTVTRKWLFGFCTSFYLQRILWECEDCECSCAVQFGARSLTEQCFLTWDHERSIFAIFRDGLCSCS